MNQVGSRRARLASVIRHGYSEEDINNARRELRTELLVQYVRKMVAQVPTLTTDQLNRVEAALYGDDE